MKINIFSVNLRYTNAYSGNNWRYVSCQGPQSVLTGNLNLQPGTSDLQPATNLSPIMKSIYLYFFLFLLTAFAFAQTPEDEAYTNTLKKRSDKIVDQLGISDQNLQVEVRDIIVDQYRGLSAIHDARDATIDSLKAASQDKQRDEKIKYVENSAGVELCMLHRSFIGKLSARLTPEQVDGVKNGMTYSVMPITYEGFLDMLPDLTGEQKKQIMAYLWEAREHAMDAGSSEKKHWWFGKYKGKINIYLSNAGYDLKKASKEWQERLKSRNSNK